MQLLRWNNPGERHQTASSLVRGAGCRGPNPRLRRREKNVLDMPLYRSGVSTSLRRLFAFFTAFTLRTRSEGLRSLAENCQGHERQNLCAPAPANHVQVCRDVCAWFFDANATAPISSTKAMNMRGAKMKAKTFG